MSTPSTAACGRTVTETFASGAVSSHPCGQALPCPTHDGIWRYALGPAMQASAAVITQPKASTTTAENGPSEETP